MEPQLKKYGQIEVLEKTPNEFNLKITKGFIPTSDNTSKILNLVSSVIELKKVKKLESRNDYFELTLN